MNGRAGAPAGGPRVHGAEEVGRWLDRMAEALAPTFRETPDAAFVGIRRGGVDVARALRARAAPEAPFGELDIAFYRDDFGTRGLHPRVGPSAIDFAVDGRAIVLVDDVVGTGRTVRAALNEIFDFGRPARVTLAALVDRGGRELPFAPEIVGARLEVGADEHVDYDAAAGTVAVRAARAPDPGAP